MTETAVVPYSTLSEAERNPVRRRRRVELTTLSRRAVTSSVALLVLITIWSRRHQLGAGFHVLDHLRWWWLPVVLASEALSLTSFSMLQRRLLRAGEVKISGLEMLRISVAANAISGSLPGGAAWSTPWSWRQLRQHGADRRLATWVVVAAGVLSSLALFLFVIVGTELAGDYGPVASLRWVSRALAVIAVTGAVLWLVASSRLRQRLPSSRFGGFYDRLRVARLSRSGWAVSMLLALANWLLDLACLIACIAAVGARIDWRSVVVVYALTQLIAVLPFTPGGLGVVETGLAALLVSYGAPTTSAIATVVLYRAITFWALVPTGWVVWWRISRRHPFAGRPGIAAAERVKALDNKLASIESTGIAFS
ncbi:MAG TPA: lysylphosphatidylglycerol synthase transmembrane domain-containing protein [Acidimicrobiales bacterium]|nr:lysylphosphatidylglycerol synthase transmembrane domain-containing protein [Acidimicrobiales bacterium]